MAFGSTVASPQVFKVRLSWLPNAVLPQALRVNALCQLYKVILPRPYWSQCSRQKPQRMLTWAYISSHCVTVEKLLSYFDIKSSYATWFIWMYILQFFCISDFRQVCFPNPDVFLCFLVMFFLKVFYCIFLLLFYEFRYDSVRIEIPVLVCW